MPATVTWNITGSGDWNQAANWSGGIGVPQSGDDVVIDTVAAATVTIQVGDNISVRSLTVGSNDTLSITGGAITLAQASSIENLLISGGTFGSTSDTTVNGQMNWSGGALNGRVNVAASATLDMSGSLALNTPNGYLENHGTATWNGGTLTFNLGTGSAIGGVNNFGTMTVGANSVEVDGSNSYNPFTNYGTLTLADTGDFIVHNGFLHNGSTGTFVQSGSGDLELYSTQTGINATMFDNDGIYQLASDADLISSGTGDTRMDSIGSIKKTGGNGTSTLSVNGNLSSSGTVRVESGTLAWDSETSDNLSTGYALVAGQWNVQNGATLQFPVGTNITSNQAVVTLDGAGSSISGLTNLATNNNSFVLLNGATFTTVGNFTNNSWLAIGSTVGASSTLTVSGAYTQGSGGSLSNQIASVTQFGHLVVTGAATLAGNVNVNLTNGFTPSSGQSFQLATFASHSGGFNSYQGLGANFLAHLNSTDLTLETDGMDLVPSGVTSTANSVFAGLDLTVNWQVDNTTARDHSGDWQDSVYLSPTPTITGSSVLLGRKTRLGIAASGSYVTSLTAPVPTVPAGTYYVLVVANDPQQVAETDLSNNTAVAVGQVNVEAAVQWDGGTNGTGTDWNVATNWVGDVLPGPSDDVVIGTNFAGVNITSNQAVSVRSLHSRANLTIAGNSFAVAADSDLAQLTVQSAGTFLANGGTTTLQTGTLAGTLGGAGTVLLSGSLNWSGGTMTGSGTTVVSASATLTISSASAQYLDGRALVNAGVVILSGLDLRVANGAAITNQSGAEFRITNAGSLNNGGGTATFTNNGRLLKTNGTTYLPTNLTLVNHGTFEVQSGAMTLSGPTTLDGPLSIATGSTVDLNWSGSTFTFTPQFSQSGSGTLRWMSGTFAVNTGATATVTNVLFSGGTLSGAGTLLVSGSMNWSGGTMTGGGTTVVAAGSTLTISSASALYLDGRALVNTGVVILSGLDLRVANGAVITNQSGAEFRITNAGSLNNGGGTATFTNNGRLLKTNGTTYLPTNLTLVNHGAIDVQSGAMSLAGPTTLDGPLSIATGSTVDLNWSGSTFTFTPQFSQSGSGTLRWMSGTFAVNTGATATVTNVLFSGGTLDGAGTLTVSGAMDWSGGTMTGSGSTVVSTGSTLDLSGPFVHYLTTRTLDNSGVTLMSGAGDLRLATEATVRNRSGADFRFTSAAYTTNGGGTATFYNEGRILKTTGASSFTSTMTLVNTGVIEVQSGTLNLSGDLDVGGNGVLAGLQSGTLIVPLSLTGATTNADLFAPSPVTLGASGTSFVPAYLEAMSADQGSASAGFTKNFAFNHLTIAGYVRLRDNNDNAAGAGAEAVYADWLTVNAGATLDLNGLHVYTRHADLVGTVTNGSVIVVPDSGPIALNAPLTGAIATNGEADNWMFYGRAGQTVTVTLRTGIGGSPQPPSPTLNYAALTLLDPGNVVIAQGTTVSAGSDVTLQAVVLSADGMYQVQVGAPPAQPTSTGYYVLGVWDATVQNLSLPMNEDVTDKIDTSYQLDKWTFSAAAGQQVQFDILNASTGAIRFDLTGPSGYIGFTNRSTDSSLLTLPTAGTYTLTAYAVLGEQGSYAFRMNQTPLADLIPNTPLNGTLSGSRQSMLYRVPLGEASPLLVNLDDSSADDRNEVYVKFGSPPTREDYQFRSTNGAGADQTVLVPQAAAGDWYVLVYGESVPAPSNFTLRALTSSVFLETATPGRASSTQAVVTTVKGIGFQSGTVIELVAANNSVIAAESVQLDTPTQMTATFAAGLPVGTYSIRARQPNGETSTLTDTLQVTAGTSAHLVTNLIVPSVLGYHGLGTIWIEYSNTGNTAMPAPLLMLRVSQEGQERAIMTLDPTLITAGFWTSAYPDGFSRSIQLLGSGATPGVLQPGETIRVPVYYAGWQMPWAFNYPPFNFTLESLESTNTAPIDWAGLESSLRPPTIGNEAWARIFANLKSNVGSTWGGYVNALAENSRYLGQQGLTVRDVGQLWSFELQQAMGLGQSSALASAVDAAYSAPGVSLDFGRVFSGSLIGRYETGPFGRGWFSSWQSTLSTEPDGTVVVSGPGGAQRRFQPDSRRVTYFSAPGDTSTLVSVGGGVFDLVESDGTRTRFRADGLIDYTQDTNGNRVTAGYTTGRLTSLTHTSGRALTIAYNGAGLVSSVTDPDGRVTTYTYDAGNEHLLQVTRFDGTTTQYTYAADNALLSVGYANGTHDYFTYDPQGRLIRTEGDGGVGRVDYTFDVGKVTATDLLGATTQLFFDDRGLVDKAIDPLGRAVFLSYDSEGNLTRATDPLGQSSYFTYDPSGRLTQSLDPLGQTINYTYGSLDRLTSFTDSQGRTTSYDYDSKGNLLSIAYPNQSLEHFEYDPLGNLTESTNRRGHATDYQHDADGRVTQKTYDDGSITTFAYDSRGNLLSATNPEGVTSMTYEAGTDRLTRITYPSGKYLDFTYDSAGRRLNSVDQDGFTVKYSYDSSGRLEYLRDGSDTLIVQYQYDTAGRLTAKLNGNGTSTTFTYDLAGQLLSLVNYAPGGSTVNSRFDYTYDALGRRDSMHTLDGDWTYEYDATGQLTHAVFTSSGTLPNQDLRYTYDAAGNRTQTLINGVTTTYLSNNLNQYTQVGSATYQYDADGNLIAKSDTNGITTYTFDDDNQLVSVSGPDGTFTYSYDGLGNRIESTANGVGTQYVIDPGGFGDVAGEYTSGGAAVAKYVHGGGLVSRVDSNGTNFYDFDGLGSTAGMTNAVGNYVNKYHYLPFGETTIISSGVPNPFDYAGVFGVSQDPSGLSYMRARYYSSGTGQFISDDPLSLAGGDSNVRLYAANSPTNQVDPTGLKSWAGIMLDKNTPYGSLNDLSVGTAAGYGVAATHAEVFHDDGTSWGDSGHGFGYRTSETAKKDSYFAVLEFNDEATLRQAERMVAEEKGKHSYDIFSGLTNGPTGTADAQNCQTVMNRVVKKYLDLGGGVTYKSKGYHLAQNLLRSESPPDQFATDLLLIGNQLEQLSKALSLTVGSQDPNQKLGPAGFGSQRFSTGEGLLAYRIDFENDASATAPAQRVTVYDQLDSNLDLDTFELTSFGFGDIYISVPLGLRHYSTVINLDGFQVEVELGLDSDTRRVYAIFQSVDPATKLPPDVLTGFLLPEDGTGRGMGFFSYLIRAKPALPTGTEIRNIGIITFDGNPAIATNQIDPHDPAAGTDPALEAFITIDAGGPTSAIDTLPATTSSLSFPVSWTGSDDAGGSGVASFDIYVSDNGGSFTLWKHEPATTLTDTFTGQDGHTYSFKSIATDNVGHVEAVPASPQSTTISVPDTTPPVVDTVVRADTDPTNASSVTYTVTFSEPVQAGTVDAADFALTSTGDASGTISDVTGSGAQYTVTVSGITGTGTLRLDVPATATILDVVGNPLTAAFTAGEIYTVDRVAPTVTGIASSTTDGTYGFGSVIDIQVTFTEPVSVAGIPTLALNTGGTATYIGGSGTDTLTFSYTVALSEASPDLDSAGTAALTLNGGTIEDALGNDADLNLPSPGAPGSLGDAKNIVINAVYRDLTIRRNGANLEFYDNLTNTVVGTQALSDSAPINVTGDASHDDKLTIDFSAGGAFSAAASINFNGGGGESDSFTILGDSASTGGFTSGTTTGSGTFTIAGTTINVTNLTTQTVSGLTSIVVNTTGGDDSLTVSTPAAGQSQISGGSGGIALAPLTFFNIGNVTLDTSTNDTGANTDSVTIAIGSLNASGLQNFTVTGGAGADTLSVPASSLVLPVGGGAFTFNGGADTDRVSVDGDVNMTLTNTSLVAGTGTLLLSGIEAASLIGGTSANSLNAGAFTGNVEFTGGAGNDIFTGGAGIDTVVESGNVNFTLTNTSLTGLGTDTLSSIEQARLTGGIGNNTITATTFTGSVVLDGGAGIDKLTGGAGNDTLIGGPGNDALIGGSGTDTVSESGDVNFTLTNTKLVGQGTDTLSGIEQANLTGGAGNNIFTVTGCTLPTTLIGGGGIDTVTSTNDANFTLTDSTLTRSTGGTFTLNSIEQANLTGGASNNTLDASGFSGNATLNGGAGNDTLIGGSGNDTLTGGLGDDNLNGGAGVNTVADTGNVNFTLTNTTLTGLGTDTLTNLTAASLKGGTSANTLDASAFAGDVTLSGGGGIDTLIGGSGTNHVAGSVTSTCILVDGKVTIGSAVSNLVNITDAILTGTTSANTFTVTGWTGTATLNGGAGTDKVVSSNNANFTLNNTSLTRSTGGTFTLSGVEAATLTGGSAANTFDLTGWTGTATVTGGGGSDQLISNNNAGNLTLTNTTVTRTAGGTLTLSAIPSVTVGGDSGANIITVSARTTGSTTITGDSLDRVVSAANGNATLTNSVLTRTVGAATLTYNLSGVGQATLTGGTGNDTLDATGFNGVVTFTGGTGNDVLKGGSGTNTVAEAGNVNFTLTDTSLTGLGTDTLSNITLAVLTGGTGANTINASAFTGNVTLTGGAGNDVLTGGSGTNMVVETGNVNLTLTGDSFFATMTGLGTDTLSNIGEVRLTGGTSANIINASGYSGKTILDGGSGNDTLTGGTGFNVLVGNAGNDILNAGSGRDVLIGGVGTDQLDGGVGDNLLIGGAVNYPATSSAFQSIVAEWLSGHSYSQRVAFLRSGGGLNGSNVLNATTAPDDAAADTVTGGAGLDWFLASLQQDTITDLLAPEVMN